MKKFYGTAAAFALLALVFYASGPLVTARNFLTMLLADAVAPARASIQEVLGKRDVSELESLREENERLKARLSAASGAPYSGLFGSREAVSVKIYSAYPFNNRGLVSINAGLREGIKPGMPVLAEEVFLFGRIDEVFDGYSIVRTVFDSGWELPVKIGAEGVDALLVGGREPRLTLIVKDVDIEEGNEVWSSGRDFPYGLAIGVVSEIEENAASAFRGAVMRTLYEAGDLRDLLVLL